MSPSYQAYGNRQDAPYTTDGPKTSSNLLASSYPPDSSPYKASKDSLTRAGPRSPGDDSDESPIEPKPSIVKVTGPGVGKGDVVVLNMRVSRTPSPTPSEAAELNKGFFDWKAMRSWRYWIRREWLTYYIVGFFAIIFVTLFTVYHQQIVKWLQPAANWMHDLPAGWLIPIAIFFVISFPPLFGHEILAILCGLVWGLWIGFGIVAAGTFLGELGNFYAFKYCCSARGEKYEQTKLTYGCLAKVVREGGFRIALIARFSAIPGHFTTAVFSTCGMSVWTFSIAAILSLPKQFITVYLGYALEQSENGQSTKTDSIVKSVAAVVTVVVTFGAMWYIYREMAKVKPTVIYERRKMRQAKLERAQMVGLPYTESSTLESATSGTFNPNKSATNVPLQPHGDLSPTAELSSYQQWDNQGHAVGYSGDPTLYAPRPQRIVPSVSLPASFPSPTSRSSSSAASGDARTGGQESYQMKSVASPRMQSKVPPPLYSEGRPHSALAGNSQSRTGEKPFGSLPGGSTVRIVTASSTSQQATPTQAAFSPTPPKLAPPPSLLPSLQIGRGHTPEASDASYFIASDSNSHSRGPTEYKDPFSP